MTSSGPSGQQAPEEQPPPAPTAAERANRMSAANMLRSLLPLVVIVLLVAGWVAFRQSGIDPVRPIDPTSSVRLAAERASYTVEVPAGLPDGYRPTSARTDAADAGEGEPVTLEIGYVTPSDEYAGFLTTDDPDADRLRAVLDGAQDDGSVDLAGRTWTRQTNGRGETVLSLETGDVTTVVTGSADDDELQTVATAVAPVSVPS